MLWPLVLPIKIALCLNAATVVGATLCAPALKWNRGRAFFISSLFACVAFIPLVFGISTVVDAFRFGRFHYASFADVNDVRVQRFLPPAAKDFELEKRAQGYRARYRITETEFQSYVDGLWNKYGELSAASRDDLAGEGLRATQADLERHFQDLGWKPLENAFQYHSPVEADGGGATYYFDGDAGIVYHRAGYW